MYQLIKDQSTEKAQMQAFLMKTGAQTPQRFYTSGQQFMPCSMADQGPKYNPLLEELCIPKGSEPMVSMRAKIMFSERYHSNIHPKYMVFPRAVYINSCTSECLESRLCAFYTHNISTSTCIYISIPKKTLIFWIRWSDCLMAKLMIGLFLLFSWKRKTL